jgi:hypothetical protein
MGFKNSFFFGYSNNHLGYFTTEKEYQAGGYEVKFKKIKFRLI